MVVRNKHSKMELRKLWLEYRKSNPRARIRDSASALGVSEMELLCTELGAGVVPLREDWSEIIARVEKLGYVMALTRNESCVIENKGYYKNSSVNGNVGLVLGENIDLRIFYDHWKYGFFVQEESHGKLKRSLQFFDENGNSIHKIYLTEKSNQNELASLVESFQSQIREIELIPTIQKASSENWNVNKEEFLNDWSNLQDTHDFFGMLKKHGVSRIQAMNLAEGSFTSKAQNVVCKELLQKAIQNNLEIMAFVGNLGMIQIFTGKVQNFKEVEDWWNVLDNEFNLHLKSTLIESTWIVRKPTKDGDVHSIEVYDKTGEIIVQFFGKRKPGNPELETWRDLVGHLKNLK